MADVRIIEVDDDLHAKTDMKAGTRMVAVDVPPDRTVTVHARVNSLLQQKVQVFDDTGYMHFEWSGRGKGRSLGCGTRTFQNPPLLLGCTSYQEEHWVVSDLNVRSEDDDEEHRVIVQCEDGGDLPGDWDDLVVTLSWQRDTA